MTVVDYEGVLDVLYFLSASLPFVSENARCRYSVKSICIGVVIILCFYYTQKEKLCQYAERGGKLYCLPDYEKHRFHTWQAVHQGALMRKTAFFFMGNIPHPLTISEKLAMLLRCYVNNNALSGISH